jgi:predicted ATPase/DNA-binding SARP family transcriptional activator
MTHICQIRLLGNIQIETEAGLLQDFRSRKALALLAYLVRRKQPVARSHLADLWWGDQAEARGRGNLRRELAYLSTILPGCFEADRQTIRFNPIETCWVDTLAFDKLAPTPRPAQPEGDQPKPLAASWLAPVSSTPEDLEAQAARLAEAVALYQGDFMAGFYLDDCPEFEMWLLGEQQSWRQRVTNIFDCLTVYYGFHQRENQALLYAKRWLELEPWQEVAHQHLMRLLTRTGQRSAALAQYETCRRILADELGVEPSAETVELHEQIRSGKLRPEAKREETSSSSRPVPQPTLDKLRPGPAAELTQIIHNLPLHPTPFVGRRQELADLAKFLDDPDIRLITILAPGGMGKTRLALAAAEDYLSRMATGAEPLFSRGVYFVPLAPLGEMTRLVSTIAEALGFPLAVGVQQTRTPEQQLLDYLHQKHLLLILDNFEHLLSLSEGDPGAVELVVDILQTAPGVQILVTSRERLNLSGEQVYPIDGLDFPDEETLVDQDPAALITESAAFKMFWLSARRARPDFELAGDDLPYLGQICRLVQGMPLGIELAAAWVSLLSLADIVAEIRQSLDFLETDARDVPKRQRSLRAVFDTSWNYLSEAEQFVFTRLSVFRGDFTRQAGQKICDASLRVLSTLASKSFLQYNPARDRYQIHELLSQYGGDKLAEQTVETSTVKDRHSHYYLNALHHRQAALKGAGQHTALAEIEADIENIWAAWQWALARGDLEYLKPAMDSLGYFYKWQGRYQEGLRAYRLVVEALAEIATPNPQRTLIAAKAMAWQSVFDRLLGQNESAGELLQQSLALLDNPVLADQDIRLEQAFILLQMGHLVLPSNLDEALLWYNQSLALYQVLPDPWGAARALAAPAEARGGGENTIAKERLEESLTLRRWLGDKRGIADNLVTLSTLASYEGNTTEALRLAEESLALYREIGNPVGVARGLNNLARIKTNSLGQSVEAYNLQLECVAIYKDLGDRSSLPMLYAELGLVTTFLGRPDEARAYVKQALDLARELGNQLAVDFSLNILGFVGLASAAYDEAQKILQECLAGYQQSDRLWDRSSAFTLMCLAYVAKKLGNINQAQYYLVKMLRVVTEFHNSFALVIALPLIALLLAEQSKAKSETALRLQTRAMELYGLAWRYPLIAKVSLFEDMVGRELVAIAPTLPSDVVKVARARGRALDLWQTADELLAELPKLGWGTVGPLNDWQP